MIAPVNEQSEIMDGQAEIAKKQFELMGKWYNVAGDLAKAIEANCAIGSDECDYEEFKKLSPPSFKGNPDPTVAEA